MTTYFHYNTYGFLNIAAGVFDITLGAIVLFSNRKSSLHRVFFLFTLVSSVWVISYGFMSILRDDNMAVKCLGIAFIGVSLIPITLYQLSRRVSGLNNVTLFELAGYIVSIPFFSLMIVARPAICQVQWTSWGRFNFFQNTGAGWAYFLSLMVYFTVYISVAYRNFLMTYRNERNIEQKRNFRIILTGFSIVYLGMIDFAVTKGLPIYPPGFVVLTALVSIISYAIVRHRMWNINVTIRRIAFVVLSYTFLFGFSIPLLYPIARNFLGDVLIRNIWLFIGFSALFGLILSTGPFIFSFLERHTFWLKKHITTGLTHELKSPIGAIQGATEVLHGHLSAPEIDREKIRNYLDMIERNNSRLENYVKNLLHVAKNQDGDITLNKRNFSLSNLINELLVIEIPSAQNRGISIESHIEENLDMNGDSEKIEQVVSNLLSNAFKFSRGGKILILLKREGDHILCSVTDEGSGINKKDLPHVFERFYQGKNINKGSGIGLTIAKAWVEAHGGKIWAESEGEGKGTKVTFTLPVS